MDSLVRVMGKRYFGPLLLSRVGVPTMYGNGTNYLKKREAVMAAMNEGANVERGLLSLSLAGWSERERASSCATTQEKGGVTKGDCTGTLLNHLPW